VIVPWGCPRGNPNAAAFGLVLVLGLGWARLTSSEASDSAPNLGGFYPTPLAVAERMLQLAEVNPSDVVYDLGSGDGRIVILAATRYGARGVGVEIDRTLVWFARRAAKREQVEHLVTFLNNDLLTVDISPATLVTLYLTRDANRLLRPRLQRQLRAGARIISHAHDMGDWPPDRTDRVTVKGEEHVIYLWRIVR
jgi:hypothetical protein